jgi:hypothetical protein
VRHIWPWNTASIEVKVVPILMLLLGQGLALAGSKVMGYFTLWPQQAGGFGAQEVLACKCALQASASVLGHEVTAS